MRAVPVVLLAACLLFCAVAALPTSRSGSDSDDVELVAPTRKQPARDESDEGTFHVDAIYTPDFTQTGYGNPFNSNFGNFGVDFGFASRIQDIIRRLYSTAPQESDLGFGSDTDEVFGGLVPVFNTKVSTSDPEDKKDDDKTETTSTVKIINGLKYVINDTVTTKNTRYGQSVFKVRTVDILPLDDDEAAPAGADATTIQPKEAEPRTTEGSISTPAPSDESVDRGSPEVLESETSNEISHNLDDAAEVLKKKANRNDKIVLLA